MTIGTLSDIAYELGLNLDKTFKEYSEQRYPLNSGRSRSQLLEKKTVGRNI
jgi:hypothetical protein